ncbi:MAG: IS91 family transposase [Thermoplasmatota archaeon]
MLKIQFKQIFRGHFERFQQKKSGYDTDYYTEVIEKMLNCAEKENGYAKYMCMECGEEKIVPFTCKSSFCLSCARIRLEEWLSKIEDTLFDEVEYRHVVLTVPEALRVYFYREPEKLDCLIKSGMEMLKDLMEQVHGGTIEFGYIVVLQTAGRSGTYNPHLHIMMTAGGLDDQDNWHDIEYIPFSLLHKKWQYYLFEMMKVEFSDKVKFLIDKLYRKYPRGIVAHIKMDKVPKREKLAKYLIKYVGSPPIALSRIINYDGKKVKYWYRDHRTNKREVAEVSVLIFIGRMVQHILPKGFKKVRYYGLHATCKAKKVAKKLKVIFINIGRKVIKSLFAKEKKEEKKRSYRDRIMEMTGEDPFRCPNCGSEMILWKIWVPGYGIIYSELEEMKNGKYERLEWEQESKEEGTESSGGGSSLYRGRKKVQLSLW